MTAPAPHRNRRWLTLIIALWLVLMGLVIWYGKRVPNAWFDPAQVAPHGFTDPAQVALFHTALSATLGLPVDNGPLFIRFAQPDCPCEQFVDGYHQLMQPTLRKQGFTVVTVTPAQMQQLANRLGNRLWQWIPSTPAILLLDSSRSVAYFGPYHQAGICNSENSYLEPVLDALVNGDPVSIVNTLVEGCFCHYPAVVSSAG
jgi:hypothetical protein